MLELEPLKTRIHTQGPIRLQEILALGGHGEQVRRWVDRGDMVRMARGLYHLPEQPMGEHQSLVEVALRSPQAVVCLLSALQFHGLTTQNPHEVWIALPQGARAPRWPDLGLRVLHLAPKFHQAGVETHTLAGTEVRVYSIAKTIVDNFRFRNLVGLDVAMEALREAVSQRRVTMDEVHRAAVARAVAGTMRPYLEML